MRKIDIVDIKSPGDLEQERVVCQVTADIDAGDYILFAAVADEDGVYSGVGKAFWLPTVRIQPRDNLVIYTKPGTQRAKELRTGGKSHFVYMGEEPAWGAEAERAAVLFYAGPGWSRFRLGGFSTTDDVEPNE